MQRIHMCQNVAVNIDAQKPQSKASVQSTEKCFIIIKLIIVLVSPELDSGIQKTPKKR